MKKTLKNKGKTLKLTTLGFTLIELLAVIVILAIIALIATPIVLDIIDDTKKSATLRSAENYIKAAEMAVAKEMMYNASFKANKCNITNEGNLDCNGTSVEVSVSGEKPSSGTLTFGSGSVTELTLAYGDDTIIRQDGELVFDNDENATDASCFDTETVYKYEIGPNCDAYFMELFGDDKHTCDEIISNGEDLLTSLKFDIYAGRISDISDISVEKLEEAEAIINVKDTNTLSITNYKCGGLESNQNAIRDIVIPSEINEKEVTEISVFAFGATGDELEIDEEKIINSVVIPDSVKIIHSTAFYKNKLKNVIIGNGVTKIGDGAFLENNIESVTIGNSVTEIIDQAFRNNNLESVTIPDSVTYIGECAFCENPLKSVIMEGKADKNDFEFLTSYAFEWAEGYSDANITWQP